MIVRWKNVGSTEFVGEWQGHSLSVFWAAPVWRAKVDGQLVKQQWASPVAAKIAVDDAIECVVMKESAAGAKAVQRPMTPHPPIRIVRQEVQSGAAQSS